MNCLDALGIMRGITSITGCNGKTTLLRVIAAELAAQGGARVILATTTHFKTFDAMPAILNGSEAALERALSTSPVACVGTPVHPDGPAGKLGPSPIPMARLAELADHVLVEADGSRGLPLKAHASFEPVIPEGSTQTIQILGASGFGRPVREAAHRPELFCELVGCGMEDAVTPELAARNIFKEMHRGLIAPDKLVVNQVESAEAEQAAREFAALVELPVYFGSIREGRLHLA